MERRSSTVTIQSKSTYLSTISIEETSLKINPCHVFGVCKHVKNSIFIPDDKTIIFPSGNYCVRYNLHRRNAEFIASASSGKGIQALALSPDRRYLAMSERGKSRTVTILDLTTEPCSKKQVLNCSLEGTHKLISLVFSGDSTYLLAQGGGPTWILFCWDWEQNKMIASVNATKSGMISQVSFNPHDDTQICVSGNEVLKLFKFDTESLKQAHAFSKDHGDIQCHAWVSEDCIVAGTKSGNLLMVKNKTLHKLERPCEKQVQMKDSSLYPSPAVQEQITAIMPYSKGFACSAGLGTVFLYEKTTDKNIYAKTTEINIPVDPYSVRPLKAITSICFCPKEEMLAISTDQGQLYHVNLTSTKIKETKRGYFEFLPHSLHTESITGMSVCTSRPIVTTCSKDNTIHIWNYSNNSLEHFKEFDEEPLSVSIHPNGQSMLLAFSTEISLMKILNDQIHSIQTYDTSNCTECVFNNDGNMFAAVNEDMIVIYNVRTREKRELHGHLKKVKLVKWSDDDYRLASCGMDSIVYVWNVVTGSYVIRKENKSNFSDVTFVPGTGTILTTDGSNIMEFSTDGVQCEMTSADVTYTSMCLAASDLTIFLGTSTGAVRIIKYPFNNETPWTEYQCHTGPITRMAVTGDQFLLTASEDGSLFVWTIMDQDGKSLIKIGNKIEYTDEVLCTKGYLEKKDELLDDLTAQVDWLNVERDYKLHLKELEHDKKMIQIVQNTQKQIDTLKQQIQVLKAEMEEQKVSYETAMSTMEEKYTKELQDQKKYYLDCLFVESERYYELEQQRKAMKEDYEKKLQDDEDSHNRAMKETEEIYKAKLEKLQTELKHETQQSEKIQNTLKDKAKSEIQQLCQAYEDKIKVQKEAYYKLEYEMDGMKKTMSRYNLLKHQMEELGFKKAKMEERVNVLSGQLNDANDNIQKQNMELEKQRKRDAKQEKLIRELQEVNEKQKIHLEEKEKELYKIRYEEKNRAEQSELMSRKEKSEVERLELQLQDNIELYKEDKTELLQTINKQNDIISDLKEKLAAKDKALSIEMQKVRSKMILIQRIQNNIQNCSKDIQNPIKLKAGVIELNKRYGDKEPVLIPEDALIKAQHSKEIGHLHKIMEHEKATHSRELQLIKAKWEKADTEKTLMFKHRKEQAQRIQELEAILKQNNIKFNESTAAPAIILDQSSVPEAIPVRNKKFDDKVVAERISTIYKDTSRK